MEELRILRGRLGLSPEQIAAALGVSTRSIFRWTTGEGEPGRLARREIERFTREIQAASRREGQNGG